MKTQRKKSSAFSLLVLIAYIFLAACQTNIDDEANKIDFLKKKAVKLNLKNKQDTEFTDLNVLKQVIGDAEIVMLGEPNHSSGSASLIKTRIIKFLFEQLNFDVLVLESSLFDCYEANELLQKGANPDTAFAKGVFPIWAESEQFKPLIDFTGRKNKTESKMILAGMDFQFTGNLSMQERLKMLDEHIRKIDSSANIRSYKNFINIFENKKKYLRPSNYSQIDSSERALIRGEIAQLTDVFGSVDLNIAQNAIYHRFLLNLDQYLQFIWQMDTNKITAEVANIRDRVMGENLIWIKENLYPDRKLIVWGATSHLLHNRQKKQYQDKMISMGEFVENHYGEKSVVLAVTAYSGMMGSHVSNSRSKLPDASNKSIEYLLHKAGVGNAYIDIKSPGFRAIFKEPFVARFLGYSNQKAEWCEMIDGIIYIENMQPNTKAE